MASGCGRTPEWSVQSRAFCAHALRGTHEGFDLSWVRPLRRPRPRWCGSLASMEVRGRRARRAQNMTASRNCLWTEPRPPLLANDRAWPRAAAGGPREGPGEGAREGPGEGPGEGLDAGGLGGAASASFEPRIAVISALGGRAAPIGRGHTRLAPYPVPSDTPTTMSAIRGSHVERDGDG